LFDTAFTRTYNFHAKIVGLGCCSPSDISMGEKELLSVVSAVLYTRTVGKTVVK
jgi:hypothetical protein